jgi:hypothetical protein
VGKTEEGRPLGRPRRRWEDNIKMDLRSGTGPGLIDLAQNSDMGYCKCVNEHSGSIKGTQFPV